MIRIKFYNGKGNECYKRQVKESNLLRPSFDLEKWCKTQMRICGAKTYKVFYEEKEG